MTAIARRSLSFALLLVPTLAACSSTGEILSVGRDSIKSDAGGGENDAAAGCRTAADCGKEAVCGFPSKAACGSLGTCFSTKGLGMCTAYLPGCACDGTTVNTICNLAPAGYLEAPILHAGACTGAEADAAAPCTSDGDCTNGVCGYPRADACTAKGRCFPKADVTCTAFFAGCACDGTSINLTCNDLPNTYAPKPLLHAGRCADGG